MAFSSTVDGSSVHGNHRVKWGTFTNAANDTGGTIDTGLITIFGFSSIANNFVGSSNPKQSASSGVVTLETDAGVTGNWYAIGL